MTIDIRHYAFYTGQKGGISVPKTPEEEYEEALKGFEHPPLGELYERHPELRTMAFEARMYARLHAYFHPETAEKEE